MNSRRNFLKSIPLLPGAAVAAAATRPEPARQVVEISLDAQKFVQELTLAIEQNSHGFAEKLVQAIKK